jgi:hypothetical protein
MKRLTEDRKREMQEVARAFLSAAFPVDPQTPKSMHDLTRKLQ